MASLNMVIAACKDRRVLASKLQYPYARHEQMTARTLMMRLDVDIEADCRELGITVEEAYRLADLSK